MSKSDNTPNSAERAMGTRYIQGMAHRFILFQSIGPGPHPCHWCGKPVDWIKPRKEKGGWEGVLVVDHLNNDGKDNSDGNLAPSCHSCNIHRPLRERWLNETYAISKDGTRQKAEARPCKVCGKEFMARVNRHGEPFRKGNGQYCSVQCHYVSKTIAFQSGGLALTVASTRMDRGGRVSMERAVRRTCLWCGAEFLKSIYDVRRGGGRYCSISCGTSSRNWRAGQGLETRNTRRASRSENSASSSPADPS